VRFFPMQHWHWLPRHQGWGQRGQCCADRVDGDITGDGIARGNGGRADRRRLDGVALNRTEAQALVNLCHPVELCGFVLLHCI
jgi:hypothetical protein